jgi:hypothetical protein
MSLANCSPLGGTIFLAAAAGPSASVAMLLVPGRCWLVSVHRCTARHVTLRQSLVPDHVLGWVHATWRFLVFGVQPLGALLGGALGGAIGLRATLVVSGLGMLEGCRWAFRSHVRSLRQIPAMTE